MEERTGSRDNVLLCAVEGLLGTVLAAFLLVGLFSVPISTALLFTPLARRGTGPLAATALSVAVAAAAGGLAMAVGAVATFAALGGGLLLVGDAAWMAPTRAWGAGGRVAWSSVVVTGALYLIYMLDWTFRAGLGPAGTAGGLLLCLPEAVGYILGLAYLWEMVDVLATAEWTKRLDGGSLEAPVGSWPFVSLHVPAHNEPPEMVIETLTSLLALDYPADRLEIVMIDDNTEDPEMWQPVADFVASQPDRLRFHHLENWPGFKSGALNFALTVTDPRTEIVGIIDADYLAETDYLRRCAPLFSADPGLGFVQTPQDYRDWEQAAYYRRLYYSYLYFFSVSQASRNERDGPIFGGTKGAHPP